MFHSRDRDRLDLHSFPTRRSSDLSLPAWAAAAGALCHLAILVHDAGREALTGHVVEKAAARTVRSHAGTRVRRKDRSEEHTSELQSRQYLVCRLLLEKKKANPVGR